MVLLTLPSNNYLIKFNIQNFRTVSEIYSVFAIKTPARRQWHLSGVFIITFEQVSYDVLMFVWSLGTGTCWLDKNCDSKVFWIFALEIWQNLWNKTVKKFFSIKFQVKITKRKTFRRHFHWFYLSLLQLR